MHFSEERFCVVFVDCVSLPANTIFYRFLQKFAEHVFAEVSQKMMLHKFRFSKSEKFAYRRELRMSTKIIKITSGG